MESPDSPAVLTVTKVSLITKDDFKLSEKSVKAGSHYERVYFERKMNFRIPSFSKKKLDEAKRRAKKKVKGAFGKRYNLKRFECAQAFAEALDAETYLPTSEGVFSDHHIKSCIAESFIAELVKEALIIDMHMKEPE
jgi:hypothetical protein